METPPRVWGRWADHLHRREYARNTPTGVGKIDKLFLCYTDNQKHPHGCGEDTAFSKEKHGDVETPPRVWGRCPGRILPALPKGNTPTGVGKIAGAFYAGFLSEKHPHGCGEDDLFPNVSEKDAETPPRVWGRSRRRLHPRKRNRNTPTGVGKIWNRSHSPPGWRKHPHGCGEDTNCQIPSLTALETPPRVWGR